MKRMLFFMLSLLFISVMLLQNSVAQDYTRWSLPHGAQARLGKGRISGNIAYSPDGSQLAVASGCGIWLYDTRIGTEVDLFTGHTSVVSSVSFSPDGNTLASCARSEPTVWLLDTATGQLKGTLETWADGEGKLVLFSPDGRTLAHADTSAPLRLWDTVTGHYRNIVDGERAYSGSAVAFSPDGATLAGAEYLTSSNPSENIDEISIWDALTGRRKLTISGTGYVGSLAFSPDGNTLAGESHQWSESHQRDEYPIQLWDVTTGQHVLTFAGYTGRIHSLAYSTDGSTLASGNHDGTIRLWDASTGREKLAFEAHEHYVSSVVYSSDGKTLASAGWDNLVRFWDAATGRHKLIISGHLNYVRSVAFSPDGRTLASGSSFSIRLWDVDNTRLRSTIAGLEVRVNVAFSPDGKMLASASGWGLWKGGKVPFGCGMP